MSRWWATHYLLNFWISQVLVWVQDLWKRAPRISTAKLILPPLNHSIITSVQSTDVKFSRNPKGRKLSFLVDPWWFRYFAKEALKKSLTNTVFLLNQLQSGLCFCYLVSTELLTFDLEVILACSDFWVTKMRNGLLRSVLNYSEGVSTLIRYIII